MDALWTFERIAHGPDRRHQAPADSYPNLQNTPKIRLYVGGAPGDGHPGLAGVRDGPPSAGRAERGCGRVEFWKRPTDEVCAPCKAHVTEGWPSSTASETVARETAAVSAGDRYRPHVGLSGRGRVCVPSSATPATLRASDVSVHS